MIAWLKFIWSRVSCSLVLKKNKKKRGIIDSNQRISRERRGIMLTLFQEDASKTIHESRGVWKLCLFHVIDILECMIYWFLIITFKQFFFAASAYLTNTCKCQSKIGLRFFLCTGDQIKWYFPIDVFSAA